MDIKKPQLVKVEAFVHFFWVWRMFCNTPFMDLESTLSTCVEIYLLERDEVKVRVASPGTRPSGISSILTDLIGMLNVQ